MRFQENGKYADRDKAARIESRKDQRDDLQRQTLLDLQEAIARFSQVVGRSHHHDTMAYKATGKWGHTLLGEGLDDEYLASQVRLQLQTERIRDDELRTLATGYKDRGVLVTMASSDREATERMDDWVERLGALQDRLGILLRQFV